MEKNKTSLFKFIFWLFTEVLLICFLIYTAFHLVKAFDIFLIIICMALVSLPLIFEKTLGIKISTPIYVVTIIYACGNIIGTIFTLFGRTIWFDKLMHGFAGFIFAAIGYYHLSYRKDQMTLLNRNIFAFSFSVTASVIWEMVEFTVDRTLNLDMQMDMFIKDINTHLISDNLRKVVHINNINEVIVNGSALPGYIDIGLIDTMYDLILGVIGALVLVIYTSINKDRHPLATLREPKNKQ